MQVDTKGTCQNPIVSLLCIFNKIKVLRLTKVIGVSPSHISDTKLKALVKKTLKHSVFTYQQEHLLVGSIPRKRQTTEEQNNEP